MSLMKSRRLGCPKLLQGPPFPDGLFVYLLGPLLLPLGTPPPRLLAHHHLLLHRLLPRHRRAQSTFHPILHPSGTAPGCPSPTRCVWALRAFTPISGLCSCWPLHLVDILLATSSEFVMMPVVFWLGPSCPTFMPYWNMSQSVRIMPSI